MKRYDYLKVCKIKKELKDIVDRVAKTNNFEAILLANKMKEQINSYDELLKNIGICGVVTDKKVIKGLEDTENLINELNKHLAN